MTRLLIATLCLGFVTFAAKAQSVDPERLALAKAYIASTQDENFVDQIVQANVASILEQIKQNQRETSAEKEARVKAIIEEALKNAVTKAQAGMDVMMARIFTTNELRALQIFADSSNGRSVLAKMPQLSAALQPRLQQTISQTLPDLIQKLREEIL